MFLSGIFAKKLLIPLPKNIPSLPIFSQKIQIFFFGKTVSSTPNAIKKILYHLKNTNCVLNKFPILYKTLNLSVFTPTKIVFHLFVDLLTTYL